MYNMFFILIFLILRIEGCLECSTVFCVMCAILFHVILIYSIVLFCIVAHCHWV
jgi:hypothetical protein